MAFDAACFVEEIFTKATEGRVGSEAQSPLRAAAGTVKRIRDAMRRKESAGWRVMTGEEREFSRGVKRWREYNIEDGAAWSQRPKLEAETYRRGFVFSQVHPGPRRRTARREARREKQKVGKLQRKVLWECMWEHAKSIYVEKFGFVKSPLIDYGYKVDELTTQGFYSWYEWFRGFEKKWVRKDDEKVIGMYKEMGQGHSAALLEKLEESGKEERERVLAEVERQRASFELALKNDDGQVGWKPIFYNGFGKVHVTQVASRPKWDGAGSARQ